MMKLMYAPPSPYARTVRIVAHELGLSKEIREEVIVVAPGTPNADYADTINPLRRIPALVLDGDRLIADSTVICEYLDARAGGKLIPEAQDLKWQVMTRYSLAKGATDSAILLRYETWLRPEEMRWPTWIDDQFDKIWKTLDWFEARGAGLNAEPNLADIALGCLLSYLDFRFADQGDWREGRPDLARWYALMAARDSFKRTDPEAA